MILQFSAIRKVFFGCLYDITEIIDFFFLLETLVVVLGDTAGVLSADRKNDSDDSNNHSDGHVPPCPVRGRLRIGP